MIPLWILDSKELKKRKNRIQETKFSQEKKERRSRTAVSFVVEKSASKRR